MYCCKLLQTLSDELKVISYDSLGNIEIHQTLSDELVGWFTLSWSHYVVLLQLKEYEECRFYEIEAKENSWSVRELRR